MVGAGGLLDNCEKVQWHYLQGQKAKIWNLISNEKIPEELNKPWLYSS